MPNCDFFAAGPDHKAILEYLFAEDDCDVYPLSSRAGQPLQQFCALSDLESRYSIQKWSVPAREDIYLQLYPHGAKGRLSSRRVDFRLSKNAKSQFRHEAVGWGLVQLHLHTPFNGRLLNSHTNHNSEKRAITWADTEANLNEISEWDWKCVEAFSRKLNRMIRKAAVAKIGSRVVLPQAALLQSQGIKLV